MNRSRSLVALSVAVVLAGCTSELVTGPQPASRAEPVVIRNTHTAHSGAPLIIVDGVIIPHATSDTSAMPLAIRNLDPNTVKSVEVIKGAAAEKLYGDRGANGVVLISTKNSGRP